MPTLTLTEPGKVFTLFISEKKYIFVLCSFLRLSHDTLFTFINAYFEGWRLAVEFYFGEKLSFAQGGQIQNLIKRGLTEREREVLKIMKSGPNLSIVLNWYDFST